MLSCCGVAEEESFLWDNFWDHEVVSQIAFRPRRAQPQGRTAHFCDGVLEVEPDVDIGYRLYVNKNANPNARRCVLVHFHANAEVCNCFPHIQQYYATGIAAVFCPDYRGYGWSSEESRPRLSTLCSDAEAFSEALPRILAEEGLGDLPVVVSGRSLGASCAIHLAAKYPDQYAGLLLESGLISIKELPLVQRLVSAMPQLAIIIVAKGDPLQSVSKLRKVTAPTLIVHGEDDQFVPPEQAEKANDNCASKHKVLKILPGCGHNDLLEAQRELYFEELQNLVHLATNQKLQTGSSRKGFGIFTAFTGLFCTPQSHRVEDMNEYVVGDPGEEEEEEEEGKDEESQDEDEESQYGSGSHREHNQNKV